MSKINVGILFGGQSAEHEVSLQSAKNVIDAIDRDKYNPLLIGINKNGQWLLSQESEFLLNATDPKLIKLNQAGESVSIQLGSEHQKMLQSSTTGFLPQIDVMFPILHGPLGEDGTIQGLFKLAARPFVGCGVLGSAVSMDKDVAKRLLAAANLPVVPGKVYRRFERERISAPDIFSELGSPVFVKPANMGSSVGVSKAKDENQLKAAIAKAFEFDQKILIEKAIPARELEVAILGRHQPKASIVGEILPQHDFYSYEAKYIDENGALLKIPADIDQDLTLRVQELALSAFKALECSGLARVDFFLSDQGELYINEINTMPGFTKISMYPKLWEASGISYADLIDQLIQLALEEFSETHPS